MTRGKSTPHVTEKGNQLVQFYFLLHIAKLTRGWENQLKVEFTYFPLGCSPAQRLGCGFTTEEVGCGVAAG